MKNENPIPKHPFEELDEALNKFGEELHKAFGIPIERKVISPLAEWLNRNFNRPSRIAKIHLPEKVAIQDIDIELPPVYDDWREIHIPSEQLSQPWKPCLKHDALTTEVERLKRCISEGTQLQQRFEQGDVLVSIEELHRRFDDLDVTR